MTKDEELMQQALDALKLIDEAMPFPVAKLTIKNLRERLAQPEQEPFGYFRYDLRLDAWVQNREGRPGTPFYTTPPQRKPLTDERIGQIVEDCKITLVNYCSDEKQTEFARAIEAAHGIKGES